MQSLIVCLSLQLPSHPQGQQQQHGPCPAVSACGEEDDPFLFEDACGAVEEYRRQAGAAALTSHHPGTMVAAYSVSPPWWQRTQ